MGEILFRAPRAGVTDRMGFKPTIISSVSELLALFACKDEIVLLSGSVGFLLLYLVGIQSVLVMFDTKEHVPLANYVQNEPAIPHIIKLLPLIFKVFDREAFS